MKNYILPLLIGLFLIPLQGQAQLLEVKQTVFGMDCAPCAYGLEKRMQKIDGVESASVSLNDGLLTANLKQDNKLTLSGIRQAVEESGFKAKEADITVEGTVAKDESGNYILQTETAERFVLKAEDKSMLENIPDAEGTIVISGKAETSEKTGTKLWVQNIKS